MTDAEVVRSNRRVLAALAAAFACCVLAFLTAPAQAVSCRGDVVSASWYGPGFHGRATASGQRFNQNAMTAAHKTLPFGTRVRVINQSNGRSATVTINDRGPFVKGRSIDLSRGAADAIGLIPAGVGRVCIETL